jgi:arginine/lysine/ornithine decarboxylase
MHTSTSPQYSIIASCDVAAAMMEPPGGTALVEESIVEALDFRRAMRKVEDEFGDDDWWFKVWGPEALAEKAWARPGRIIAARMRRPGCSRSGKEFDNWHGFGDLADGFNMLDPIKSTIVTPGLDLDGDLPTPAFPSIVTKYLAEHGVVVEKTGLYSFFIMFTIGITKGRWNTMLTALQQFKDDYDRNQPLARILPEFCQQHRRYERMGLKDLCQRARAVCQVRYCTPDDRDVSVGSQACDEALGCLCAYRAAQDRACGNRPPGRPHHRGSGHALPTRNSAADSR